MAVSYARTTRLSLGSQGPVYSAQGTDGRTVALQVVPARRLPPPEALLQVEQEIRAVAEMQHPNVLPFTKSQRSPDGSLYLVRDLREGALVSDLLRQQGVPPVAAALDILELVLSALADAHGRNIFHHHLRSDKILLEDTPAGKRLLLLDLGMARLVGRYWGMLSTAARLGSKEKQVFTSEQARSLAPEQVRNPLSANARADVYAAGVLAYELLCGEPPFAGDVEALVTQHATQRPPALGELARHRMFSAELEGLVSSMLAKQPSQRPADAGAVLTKLLALRSTGDTVFVVEDDDPSWRITREPPPPRERPRTPALAVVDLPIEEIQSAPRPRVKLTPVPLPKNVPPLGPRDAMPPPIPPKVRLTPVPMKAHLTPAPMKVQLTPVPAPRPRRLVVEERVRTQSSGVLSRPELEPPPASQPMLLVDDPRREPSAPAPSLEVPLASNPSQRSLEDVTETTLADDAAGPAPAALGGRRTLLAAVAVALLGIVGLGWWLIRGAAPTAPRPRTPGKTAQRASVEHRAPVAAKTAASTPTRATVVAAARPASATAAMRDGAPTAAAPRPLPAPAAPVRPIAAAPAPAAAALPPPELVTIRIASSPPGAEVRSQGRVVGTTPFAEVHHRSPRAKQYQIQRTGYDAIRMDVRTDRDRRIRRDLEPDMSPGRAGGPM